MASRCGSTQTGWDEESGCGVRMLGGGGAGLAFLILFCSGCILKCFVGWKRHNGLNAIG